MCYEWGIAPWEWDRAPKKYRIETFKWWVFKSEREHLLRKQAEFEAKARQQQTSAARARGGRR